MDEFAQSREDDDLFADEFEPITEPVAIVEEHHPEEGVTDHHPTLGASEESNVSRVEQHGHNAPNGGGNQRGGQRERGRGRGGRGRGRGDIREEFKSGGLSQSRYADPAPAPAQDAPPHQSQSTESPNNTSDTPIASPTSTQPPPAPPSANIETRVHAVRGDRSATGGPQHKKLTEEELSAKMAAMAILNAKKAERHRLSEADSAAFAKREKEQQQKRVEEQKSRREMDMERAKNRERKLKAQGGREWDEGKTEADIVDRTTGRSSQYVRGGHGGVIRGRGGLTSSQHYYGDRDEASDGPPTRGGRGGGSSNNRGRGGKARGGAQNSVPTPDDFPALPGAKPTVLSPTSDKPAGDWAEEMATPVAATKKEGGDGFW